MNKPFDILTARNVFVASLVLAAMLLAFLAPNAAVNVDEQLHYPHAKTVVNWYFTGGDDVNCLNTPITNLKYYGQSVDNFTALFNRVFNVGSEFLTRHFTGAFFFWLLLFFTGMIAHQLSGSFWVSAISVLSILLMPRLFGQAFGNLKDIPFATGYLAAIYLIVCFLKELPKPSWKTAILLGVAIAFTCSVRIGGLILFAYLGFALVLILILKPFLLKHIVSTKHCLVRLLGQGTVIFGIGYFVGLLFWPFALQDVLRNPLLSLSVMEHYKVSIRQVFEGDWLWSTQLPWYYLPKWLAISTPEFLFFGFAIFLVLFFQQLSKHDNKQLFYELFALFTLIFPLVYVVAIDANLYSGVRQMLFVLPLLAVFSAMGIVRLFQSEAKKGIKTGAAFFFFGTMILPLKQQAATFPADYIYFNTISGGNKKAWSNYEYDYYFHGLKEASEYLTNLVGDEKATVAGNSNLSNYFAHIPGIEYRYSRYLERSSEEWDYGLFGVNYIHPLLLKSGKWKSSEIVQTFYHCGNPVVVLLKRRDKRDLTGIRKMKLGALGEAKNLLETALADDPNNVWLYVQLAKISLKENDSESFIGYLQSSREIYPLYEPLYLLEAQYYFANGDFNRAKKVLNELFEFNPRYNKAKELLVAVNEKLKV